MADRQSAATDDSASAWLRPGLFRIPRVTWLALILILAVAWTVWTEIAARQRESVDTRFHADSDELALRIEERFRGYRQVLRGARAFFSASGRMKRDRWQQYVAELHLERDYKGIQGVGFAAWIPAAKLAAHEAAVRGEGFPDYQVWPLGKRDAYSSVVMLEPFDWRNQRAFGFDMYSEPVRREAMDRAVRTGDSALSGRARLVQETPGEGQAGVLLYLPLFDPDKPATNAAERRAALLGWVYGAFRMGDLMEGVLGHLSSEFRLRVYDQADGPGEPLYDSQRGKPWRPSAKLDYRRRLILDGRSWMLHVEASPRYYAALEPPVNVLFGLGLVSVLLLALTWLFANARERAAALRRASESLRASEARYSTLVNLAHEGIAATDESLRLTFVNPRLAELLGKPAEALVGEPLDRYWCDFDARAREALLERLRRGEVLRQEVDYIAPDGERRTLLVSDAPLTDAAGELRGAILMLADITEHKEAERRIHHLATHDALTGLPNRMMFGDLLAQAIARAERYRHRFALLFVDLDRFKEVNDNCGHQTGDRLLVEAAVRMQQSVRTADVLGRQGGDEFMVLLPEIAAENDAEVVAEKIRAALAEPFFIDGNELAISSSIGIVVYPEHGEDADTLLRHADEAMYRAKAEGRNRSFFYY